MSNDFEGVYKNSEKVCLTEHNELNPLETGGFVESQQSLKQPNDSQTDASSIPDGQQLDMDRHDPTLNKVRILNSHKIILIPQPNSNNDLLNNPQLLPDSCTTAESDIQQSSNPNSNSHNNNINQSGNNNNLIEQQQQQKQQQYPQLVSQKSLEQPRKSKKPAKITDYLNASENNNNNNNIPNNQSRLKNLNQTFTTSSQQAGINFQTDLVNQLQQKLREKETELLKSNSKVAELEEQLDNMKKSKATVKGQQKQQIYDGSLVRKVVQKKCLLNAQLNRQLLNFQLQQSKLRLGEYIIDQSSFREQWVDGFEVQELHKSLKQIENRIQSLQNSFEILKQSNKPKKSLLPTSLNKHLSKENDQQKDSNNISKNENVVFNDSDIEDGVLSIYTSQNIFPNTAAGQEDMKKQMAFHIGLLEKEREIILGNIEIKKKEVKGVIKKYQLQFLEENSRFGGNQAEDQWPLFGNRYQLLSLLGKGGFSEVYKAMDLAELREVAVKVHYIDKSWSNSTKQNYLKHAFREHGIQKELQHQNIVRLYDHIEIDGNSFASVQELCSGPDLSEHLKTHGMVSEMEGRHICKMILHGLQYLNQFENKVIHYDLKPQNILFDKGIVKITDFGLSKIMDDPSSSKLELTSQGVGTYWYLPPECFGSEDSINTQPKISNKVDIWSLGVVLYEMLFGQKPFGHKMTQHQILADNVILNSKQVKFPKKHNISKECVAFISACLQYQQEERIDVEQALAHQFFTKKY